MFQTFPISEQPEYILTPEQEQVAINNEIRRLQLEYSYTTQRLGAIGLSDVLSGTKEINWQERIDKRELLNRTNTLMHIQIEREESQKRERDAIAAEKENVTKLWNASRMYQFLKMRCFDLKGHELIYNSKTEKLIKIFCYFISRDPRFETELGYTYNKGLALFGTAGIGKSFIPQCLSTNPLNPFPVISLLEISNKLKSDGEYDLPLNTGFLYFDDMGTEETPINHYGTKIYWLKDFIEVYYSKNLPFNRIMISSNIGPNEIEEKYTERVRSRMREMFNIILVEGEDMRK